MRSQLDPTTINGSDILDFGWSLLIDGFSTSSREDVMTKVAEIMDEHPCPGFDDIGMSEAEQARSERMLSIAGGPAPMRDPNAPIPEAVARIRSERTSDN